MRFGIVLKFVILKALALMLGACGVEANRPIPATPTAVSNTAGISSGGNMENGLHLNLENPVAAAGSSGSVWIADGSANTITRYDPTNGNVLSVISLETTPVDVAVIGNDVVVGLSDGSIVMYNANSGDEFLRRNVVSGNLSLQAAKDQVWVLDREASTLAAFDLAGNRQAIQTGEVFAFAPGSDGIYWISSDGMVHYGGADVGSRNPTLLPGETSQFGAMVECGNSLWISVPTGLLMVPIRTLMPGNMLPAPEGSVPHLICDEDMRLIGGNEGVFILDFAADVNVHPVDVPLQSKLQALVAAGNRIWALESAEPIAHILQIP